MAFQLANNIGHVATLGSGTYAEVTAWLDGLSTADRIEATGMEFILTDKPGQETWKATPTTIIPLVSAGEMSKFTVKAKTVTSEIEDSDVLEFAATGVLDSVVSTGANGETVVTTSVKGTSADETKVIRIDADGNAYFDYEKFRDIEDGFTVNLALDTAGVLSAEVIPNTDKGLKAGTAGLEAKLSADLGQAIEFSAVDGGLYAKKLTVAQEAQGFMQIDSNYQISLKERGIERIKVDTTSADLATSLAAYANDGVTLEEGDAVVLDAATGGREVWLAAEGATTAATTGWIKIKSSLTLAEVSTLIDGEYGVQFNAATGKFRERLKASTLVLTNDMQVDANGMWVDIMAKSSDIGFGEQGLGKNLSDLYNKSYLAYNREYKNGITKTTDANGLQTVVLGGDLIEPTTIAVLDQSLDFTATTGAVNFTTDNVNFNHSFTLISDNDETLEVYINSLRTLKVRVPN